MSIKGLHLAARTLTYLTRKSVVLQNNLANQSTDGFKLDYAFGTPGPGGVPTLNQAVKMSQGGFLRTGNPLDVALDGSGFFAVESAQGTRLTRNGSFHIEPETNRLVDTSGAAVLGMDGPIVINGSAVEIGTDGTVTVDGTVAGQLRIVNVANPSALEKEGSHLFIPPGALESAGPETLVRQFDLEESNVNGVDGIGDLIQIQRSFAMMTGAMQSLDDVLETVTGSVGRV